MGESATERHVTAALGALETILRGSGNAAVAAAKASYSG